MMDSTLCVYHRDMPARATNVKWKCQLCGKQRWLKPHRARRQKYCSQQCKNNAARVPNPVRRVPQRPRVFAERDCERCGLAYLPRAKVQKFCGRSCWKAHASDLMRARYAAQRGGPVIARPCEECGAIFKPSSGAAGRFCSRPCFYAGSRGPRAPHWRGGRQIRADGYVDVWAPEHPNAKGHGGYVKEHRVVMEQQLGRLLCSDESVHHINGDRSDNRLDNLQLRQGRHGKGVAYQCGDCGSHNVVAVAIAAPPTPAESLTPGL